MLIIGLIFASIRTLRGIPLSSPLDNPDATIAFAPRDTQTHFGQRGVNDIIISCFATILACTWSAVHPNIPAVTDSPWTCFKRRATITVCALLAPEIMTWWAMNQRRAAKDIMDKYNGALGKKYLVGQDSDQRGSSALNATKGWFGDVLDSIRGLFQDPVLPTEMIKDKGPRWTLEHGFFLQMGGFMACTNGIPSYILTQDLGLENPQPHRGNNFKAETKKPTTGIIYNVRKKIIAPPRFTKEDIKDRSKGDVISKTFILLQTTWFIVQCIARWSARLPVTELEVVTLGFAMLNGVTYGLWWHKPQNVDRPVFLERDPSRKERTSTSQWQAATELTKFLQALYDIFSPSDRDNICRYALLVLVTPILALLVLLMQLVKMAGDHTVTNMRVGMFYTGHTQTVDRANITLAIVVAVGVLFGALHLIPSWTFLDFPSRQEMWLWRVAAIITTAEPVAMGSVLYLGSCGWEFLAEYITCFNLAFIFLYPIARITLLTLSLTGLRLLPPPALQTIEWITFIPHL